MVFNMFTINEVGMAFLEDPHAVSVPTTTTAVKAEVIYVFFVYITTLIVTCLMCDSTHTVWGKQCKYQISVPTLFVPCIYTGE